MKKIHPFYFIGTLGIIISAFLHIFLALGLSIASVHTSFFILYAMFSSFLIIGMGLTLQKQKQESKSKV